MKRCTRTIGLPLWSALGLACGVESSGDSELRHGMIAVPIDEPATTGIDPSGGSSSPDVGDGSTSSGAASISSGDDTTAEESTWGDAGTLPDVGSWTDS